jgi:hypothetical protein
VAPARRYLVEDIVIAAFVSLLCLGEILDLGLLDRTMATRGAALPHRASFLEQMLAGGALRWSGLVLTASMTVGLGGVAPQSLDKGHMLRCSCREEAPWWRHR